VRIFATVAISYSERRVILCGFPAVDDELNSPVNLLKHALAKRLNVCANRLYLWSRIYKHDWLVIVFENSLHRLCALALLNVFIIGCKGAVEEPGASVPEDIQIFLFDSLIFLSAGQLVSELAQVFLQTFI